MKYNTHKLIMTGQLNSRGSLFGGQCLSWIDEEAAIFAISLLGTTSIVTKCMSEINFKAPAHCGDIVEIGTSLVSLGNTSITISCTIRNKTTKQEIVTVDKIVFVHVGEDGKSKPHGITLENRHDE
jgi:acyl-CoA thioesterase YciA